MVDAEASASSRSTFCSDVVDELEDSDTGTGNVSVPDVDTRIAVTLERIRAHNLLQYNAEYRPHKVVEAVVIFR